MKLFDKFYLNVGVKALIALCFVYSFMIFSFIWGNHDWLYLKDKISYSENWFEARLTIHFFNLLFAEGLVLPVFTIVFGVLGIVILGIVVANYLEIPKTKFNYMSILLLIGMFPYNFVVFYYLYTVIALYWWAVFGVALLFLAEGKIKNWKIAVGGIGYFLLLGSYPPNYSFVLCVFVCRKIFDYVFKGKSVEDILKSCLFLCGQILIGFIGFKLLLMMTNFEEGMIYNVRVLGVQDIILRIPIEIVRGFSAIYYLQDELGWSGVCFLMFLICVGGFIVFEKAKNKFVALVMMLALLLCSRFMFLVASEADVAYFRGGYWGILGIVVFGVGVFCFEHKMWRRNVIFVFECVFLMIFIVTDFEIQKTRKLMFDAEIKFMERVKNRIERVESFDYKNNYTSLIVGKTSFWEHFCFEGCKGYNNEILSSIYLSGDFISLLFFDDEIYPVTFKLGWWDSRVWKIQDGRFLKFNGFGQAVSKDEALKIMSWAYKNVKKWPNVDSLYIDKKRIFMMFDGGMDNIYVLTPLLINVLNDGMSFE